MKLLLWILISYGISQIVVESGIFRRIRSYLRLRVPVIGMWLSCMLCFSVWVGFVLSVFIWSPTRHFIGTLSGTLNINYPLIVEGAIFVFLDGMMASASVWWIHILEIKVLDRHHVISLQDRREEE